MITRAKPIPKKRKSARRGRVLNPAYLLFVRQFACVVCYGGKLCMPDSLMYPIWQDSRTEAAHVGDRGLGQKCSDEEALPLCATGHHREGKYSAHVLGKNFFAFHRLDRDKLIAEMQRRFTKETGQAL